MGCFTKLEGAVRTSLYVDDAALLFVPFRQDIQDIASILHGFGEVTALCTNFKTCSVLPFRCGEIDLDYALHGLLVETASFTCKYLGLPLSIWYLLRADVQQLED
jgi:hypothetical protein